MKTGPSSVYVLAVLLLILGASLSVYRHVQYEVPWLPGEQRTIWSIEAKIEFDSQDAPVKASFATPDNQPGFERLSERTASPGFGLAFVDEGGARRVEAHHLLQRAG
ncbi:MAG TPA: UUP1 family membrane protein, partial [Cellvibrionaceae bacterium]|nr:UUP1 family membrane protein [Cellvibrionaceae bacterium]